MRSDKTTRWRAVWRTRLYEREKVEVLGPGSVILEDSQLSLRILGYVNHKHAHFKKIVSLAAAFEWLGGGRFSTSSQPLGSRNRAVCTHDSRQLGVSLALDSPTGRPPPA